MTNSDQSTEVEDPKPAETSETAENMALAEDSTAPQPPDDPCQRTFVVSIPAEVVTAEMASVAGKFQKEARLPGFRKGKVPLALIRSKFAKDIKTDVLEHLVPEHLRAEIEKQGLTPVSQPRITDLKWDEGEPAVFTAVFDVLPEISLGDYASLATDRPEITVPEDEVENALNEIRERNASFDPIEEERALADGDFAQASFTGTPVTGGSVHPAEGHTHIAAETSSAPTGEDAAGDAERAAVGAVSEESDEPAPENHAATAAAGESRPAPKPVSVDEVLIEIGGPGTVAEFSENLRGARPGDERVFDVTYPENFEDQRLAGATMHYTVQIKSAKRKSLPELNDDFAKSIGEFASMDALRSRVRERMLADRTHEIEHEGKEKLVDELLQRHPFPAPESMVQQQIDMRLERGFRALVQQGMKVEDIKKMNIPHLRDAQREPAVREVRSTLLLDKIAETEKIEVSDEELNREVDMLAVQSQVTPEAIRARLTRDGALDRLRERIRNEKTLDFLYRRPA